MTKKRPDLKRRLAEIRQEPAPPVDVSLTLDAELYQALKTLARKHRQPLDAYLIRILEWHIADCETPKL
jgi:hypothetical protein